MIILLFIKVKLFKITMAPNQTKIKLLIFTPSLRCGGSEKYVSLLCNHINTEIFSVTLVVLNNADPFYKIKNTNIEVVDLEQQRTLFSLFRIKKIIKQYQPDIIFTVANHLNLYFAIFRNSFPKQIKMVARESSIVSINSRRAKFPLIYNNLIKRYYRRFDLIICQSAYMQQDIVSNYHVRKNKTVVIHNPVELFSKKDHPAASATSKTYKFITVGRLSEEKGMERLIHAVGLLSMAFEFYIVGEGDKKRELQNLINELELQDKIFLKGEKTDPFEGMEDADLFLMGSYYEGFPNVLLEAGALGIPVIAFNVPGGIAEIIAEGENGLLADDNDIIGFASTIRKGLSLNFDREKITALAEKRFSVHTVIPQAEKLFMGLL